MIYQFLGMGQRIINLAYFANNAIHPRPQVMPKFGREMPQGFSPAISLHCNLFCISTLENRADKSIDQNFENIVLDSHAKFREKLS